MQLDLQIANGAIASDGGSVYLEAIAVDATRIRILLDWSIAAQKQHATRLMIDDRAIEKHGEEESEWIVSIASAATTDDDLASLRDDLVAKLRSPTHAKPKA